MSQIRQGASSEQRQEESINDDLPSSRRPFAFTVEVPLFVIMLAFSLSGTVISNIILYRTCLISLNYPEESCQVFLSPVKNNNTRHLEEEVQKYATYISTVKTVIEAIGPAILSLFLSVWSDTHGRKPLVVWPLLGASITAMMTVIYSMLDNFGPWWYILAVIPFSLTGGFTVLFTGCFCYLNDITTTEKKSIRMVILEAAVSLGSVLGSVTSSPLLVLIGNTYLLLLSATITVLGYAYCTVFLSESLPGAVGGGLSSVADVLLVKEMIRDCFKWRPNNLRAIMLLLTISNSLSIFILYGTFSLDYLYVRQKLNWAMKQYMIFSATSTMVSFVGGLCGLLLVRKLFKMGDVSISIVAFISAMAEYVIKMLATTSWHFYLARSVSFLKGLSAPLIRSYLTKTVPVEDIAKIFALMCAIEAICPLFAPVMYNSLYAETLTVFPGAFYLLSTGITLGCVIMLGFVQYFRYKSVNRYTSMENDSVCTVSDAVEDSAQD